MRSGARAGQATRVRFIELSGTPKAMGEAFGEVCRAEIQEFYDRRLTNAISQAKEHGGRVVGEPEVLELSRRCLVISEGYDPDGTLELVSIARGANLPPEKIFAMNQLTDLRDVLAWGGPLETDGGCSSFMIQGDLTKDGNLLLGQTWDLASDNMPFVVGVKRTPKDAPATACLTTVGCLSLIGMNEEGLVVGTTNLRTKDARPGVGYLSIIHRALGCKDLLTASQAVTQAPRAGGHYYYLADGKNRAAAFECSATSYERISLERGHYVQTNHVQSAAIKVHEADTPAQSSRARHRRLVELIEADRAQGIDLERAKLYFADTENGVNAICRDDFGGISTNGAVLAAPARATLLMTHGLPSRAAWVDVWTQA